MHTFDALTVNPDKSMGRLRAVFAVALSRKPMSYEDYRRGVTLTSVQPLGPVVKVDILHAGKSPMLPQEVKAIFEAAKVSRPTLKLATCRKPGVPEAADGSHFEHYIVPESIALSPIGMTI